VVRFKFRRLFIGFDFSFFAAAAVFLALDKTGLGILGISACALHELGHLAAIAAVGEKFSGIDFYGGGIRICGGERGFFTVIAGCLANLLTFAAFAFTDNIYAEVFSVINLFVCAFNLLPAGCLDGKHIFEAAVCRLLPPQRAVAAAQAAEAAAFVLLAAAVAYLTLAGYLNIASAFAAVYIVIVEMI